MDRSRLSHILLCGLISSLFAPLSAAQDRDTSAPVLPAPYQKWLAEDVSYIITKDERTGFAKLTSNQQRDWFIEDFWERRNPDPGSARNTFKEEHYRRLAYTNQHFAATVAGYKTDRGRIYILYGPPDEREQHPGHPDLAVPENAPLTALYPSDIWRYHFIPGVGKDVVFEFIDTCLCQQYRLREDPTKRRPSSRRDKNRPLPVKTFTGCCKCRDHRLTKAQADRHCSTPSTSARLRRKTASVIEGRSASGSAEDASTSTLKLDTTARRVALSSSPNQNDAS